MLYDIRGVSCAREELSCATEELSGFRALHPTKAPNDPSSFYSI